MRSYIKHLFVLPLLIINIGCVSVSSPTFFTSTSPDSKYSIIFEERRVNSESILKNNDIFVSVFYEGSPVVKSQLFYHPDKFDSQTFKERYPFINWVGGKVLRLGDKSNLSNGQGNDTYVIRNLTARKIIFLKASTKTSEKFIVLDLNSEETILLQTTAQINNRSDLSWVSALAIFDDGSMSSGGVNFEIKEQHKGTTIYCISIKEKEAIITSRDFNGWYTYNSNDNAKTEKIFVAKSALCSE